MGQLLFLSGGTVDHPLSELDVGVVTKVIALWEAARLGWGVNKVELSHLLSGAGVDSALADQLWPTTLNLQACPSCILRSRPGLIAGRFIKKVKKNEN